MKLEKLGGCLIIENGNILMVKERKDGYWKIPSGKVDEGESLEDCAIRETREEAGVDVELEEVFGHYDFGFKNRKFQLTIYRARIIHGTLRAREGDKVTSVCWMPIEQIAIGENNMPSNNLIYNDLVNTTRKI